MLPLGGIFIAIFVGWKMKKEDVLEELKIKKVYCSSFGILACAIFLQ